MLLTIPEFLKKIKKRNIALSGDGANLYKDKILEQVPGANILDFQPLPVCWMERL